MKITHFTQPENQKWKSIDLHNLKPFDLVIKKVVFDVEKNIKSNCVKISEQINEINNYEELMSFYKNNSLFFYNLNDLEILEKITVKFIEYKDQAFWEEISKRDVWNNKKKSRNLLNRIKKITKKNDVAQKLENIVGVKTIGKKTIIDELYSPKEIKNLKYQVEGCIAHFISLWI